MTKYYPGSREGGFCTGGSVQAAFSTEFNAELAKSFARLAGFPQCLLARSWHCREVLELGRIAVRAARNCLGRPGGLSSQELDQSWISALGRVFSLLTRFHRNEDCEERLRQWLPEQSVRCDIARAYRYVASMLCDEAGRAGVSHAAFRRLCLIGVAKGAKNIQVLVRNNMVDRCRGIAKRAGTDLRQAIREWIDSLSDEADTVYEPGQEYSCILWVRADVRIYFDAISDAWLIQTGSGRESIERHAVMSSPKLEAMKRYWGSGLWDEFLAE